VVGAAFTRFAVNRFDYNYSYRYTQYNYYSYEGSPRQIEDEVASLKGPARARGRFAFLHDLRDRIIGRIT
jgi:polysaccharide biosynthesis transport protein